ncbi:hypothetical protein LCGC14_0671670 [marine sediment metagenome]|uniref:Uncharacterized protein n=1 Tax=marine sediment metagenome TaxID=412755 RepID=A0A0F9TC57_9ZZZZ
MKIPIYIDVPQYASRPSDLYISVNPILEPLRKAGWKRYRVDVEIPDLREPDEVIEGKVEEVKDGD